MGYLVIRKEDKVRIHLSEIAILIIESTAVSLTTALLNELTKKKIKVVFCDEKRNPSSELVGYYGAHDTSLKVRKQISWSEEIKTEIWTSIVTEKIKKQAEHLEELELPEAELLRGYASEILPADTTNREGHAAKVYFNALFGKSFSRADENSINAALNYGYGVLLSNFTREIVANGYITQIGLSHDNMFNQFNLASDLMEPFRILIDRTVKGNISTTFNHDDKMEILKSFNYDVLIFGRKETVSNAIKIYCRSIFDALNEKDAKLIKYYKCRYEL